MLRRRWRVCLLAIGVCVAAPILCFSLQPKPPEIVFLGQPLKQDLFWSDRLMYYVPRNQSWAWLRKLVYGTLPDRVRINLSTDEYRLAGLQSTNAESLGLGPPRAMGSDGVRVWFLNAAELGQARQHLDIHAPNVMSSSRCTMAVPDGCGSMSGMAGPVQVNADCPKVEISDAYLSRVRRDGLDTTVFITVLEGGATNSIYPLGFSYGRSVGTNGVGSLKIGARLHIPRGSSALILGTPVAELGGQSICIIIEPK